MTQDESNSVLSLGLAQLREIQRDFDGRHFEGSANDDRLGKRRHISFHLAILAAKAARVEEREDHDEADVSIIVREVIPDLLVYAAQLAEVFDVDLSTVYGDRLVDLARRNS